MAFNISTGKNAIFGLLSIFLLLGLTLAAVSIANDKFLTVSGSTSNASLVINQTQTGINQLAQNQQSLAGIIVLFILIVLGMVIYGTWKQHSKGK